MSRKKKCQKCPVPVTIGGCRFGCNKRRARLARQLDRLIQMSESHKDPILEQLRQCPEAFTVGQAVERLFESLRSGPRRESDRLLPPPGSMVSPFV